ncbi:hypothetical protein ES708_16655 [subsurface metagenome]
MLYLTLHKKWFDLIASGHKTVEYRDLKPHWIKRLKSEPELVHFRNGYNKNSPYLLCECLGVVLNRAKGRFEIMLGRILKRGNG